MFLCFVVVSSIRNGNAILPLEEALDFNKKRLIEVIKHEQWCVVFHFNLLLEEIVNWAEHFGPLAQLARALKDLPEAKLAANLNFLAK